MKHKIDTTFNELVPSRTDNLSMNPLPLPPDAAPSDKSNHQVGKNPQAFGFAFEYLQAIGFNINAGLKRANAYHVPVNRMTGLSSDIYIKQVGEIIANIQVNAGSQPYIKKPVRSEQYSREILARSDNSNMRGATILIDIDGIQSFPIRQDFAQWVAENPYLAANVMSVAATMGEVNGAGSEGAAIDAIINILFQSIKTMGAYCRGEQELEPEELTKVLEVILTGLKTGCLQGVAIKVIQKLMDGSAFAALGFTVGIEVIPTLIKVLKGEIILEQAIAKVGLRMFTSAVVTTVVILLPAAGRILLSNTVIKAIWEEISPEWKSDILKKDTDIGSAIATGRAIIALSEVGIIEQQVWQNLSAEKRKAVIEKMKQSTPEQVKIAYNMTLEKAAEAFDLASGWFGEKTSELAQSVESATPVRIKSTLKQILDNHQKTVVYEAA